MAKGSMSQASTMVSRGGGGTANSGTLSSRAPPTAAGLRKRSTRTAGGSRGSGYGGLNFYTDDSPGFKMSPVVVVTMSVVFIGFVTLLHIVGKLRGN
eukprot:jgi/Botrbrau1/17265/Bobra.0015s0024.1